MGVGIRTDILRYPDIRPSDFGGYRTQRWEEISLTCISSSLCILFIYSPSCALPAKTSSITYLHLCLSAFRSDHDRSILVTYKGYPVALKSRRTSASWCSVPSSSSAVSAEHPCSCCGSRAASDQHSFRHRRAMCRRRLCSNCAHMCESRACTGEKSSGWCTQEALTAVALRQLSCLAGAASSRYHQRQASLHQSGAQEDQCKIIEEGLLSILSWSLLSSYDQCKELLLVKSGMREAGRRERQQEQPPPWIPN